MSGVDLSIKVKVTMIRGERKITPLDENAKIFADLLRQKLFNDRDIGLIKRLGYRIEVVSDVPKEL